MNALLELKTLGQRIWLDNLSHELLTSGELKTLIERDGIAGVTSNPSIFFKAMSSSPHYKKELQRLLPLGLTAEQRLEALMIPDIQAACDLFSPVYDGTRGVDGYVSLEVSPRLAMDEEATIKAAGRLARAVARKNLLIKVPATAAGVHAFETLTEQGINVNVTLMFSLHQVWEIFQAYIRGLKKRLKQGGDITQSKAVASLFLSRVDSLVDKKLDALTTPEAVSLKGKTALSLAKLAYQRYNDLFHGSYFVELREQGASPQFLLWASTGTKNPAYSDVLYIESLIGPETINTVPSATLDAFRDHGKASLTLEQDITQAETHMVELKRLGLDMHELGENLQEEGLKAFDEAYGQLLNLVS